MSCSFQTRSSANRPVDQRDLGPELARRVGANPVALGSERRTTCAGTIAKAANATSHALELLGGEGLRAKRVSRCQRRNRSLQPIHHPIRRVQVRGRAREDGSLWPTRRRLCLPAATRRIRSLRGHFRGESLVSRLPPPIRLWAVLRRLVRWREAELRRPAEGVRPMEAELPRPAEAFRPTEAELPRPGEAVRPK